MLTSRHFWPILTSCVLLFLRACIGIPLFWHDQVGCRQFENTADSFQITTCACIKLWWRFVIWSSHFAIVRCYCLFLSAITLLSQWFSFVFLQEPIVNLALPILVFTNSVSLSLAFMFVIICTVLFTAVAFY